MIAMRQHQIEFIIEILSHLNFNKNEYKTVCARKK